MDKPSKTIGNIVNDTLTFMDDMGLSMATSDKHRGGPLFNVCAVGFVAQKAVVNINVSFVSAQSRSVPDYHCNYRCYRGSTEVNLLPTAYSYSFLHGHKHVCYNINCEWQETIILLFLIAA